MIQVDGIFAQNGGGLASGTLNGSTNSYYVVYSDGNEMLEVSSPWADEVEKIHAMKKSLIYTAYLSGGAPDVSGDVVEYGDGVYFVNGDFVVNP